MKKKITTLKELASKLNLSISTISRALNDHPDISKATKDRVTDLAHKLNYVPNIFAKGFRSNKTSIIGVIVPKISHYFTSTLISGILKEASLNGYKIILSDTNHNNKQQEEMLKAMVQFGVDGILLSLTKVTDNINPILKIMEQLPLILFDKVSDKIPCTQIVINEETAAYNAIEHLINLGKKRIAILKEQEYSYNSEKRFKGYIKALNDYQIPLEEKLILSVDDLSINSGKRLARQLISLKDKPDAIFSITDSAAIGAIKTLKKYNIKIPEEIAVIGFSNSLNSTIIEPKLTTVNQPGETIGRLSVKYLLEEIENNYKHTVPKTIKIKSDLIVRESTLKL